MSPEQGVVELKNGESVCPSSMILRSTPSRAFLRSCSNCINQCRHCLTLIRQHSPRSRSIVFRTLVNDLGKPAKLGISIGQCLSYSSVQGSGMRPRGGALGLTKTTSGYKKLALQIN